MSWDGERYSCDYDDEHGDRCGRDVGNAGLDSALVVTDLDDNGQVRTRHACRWVETSEVSTGEGEEVQTVSVVMGHAVAVAALFSA